MSEWVYDSFYRIDGEYKERPINKVKGSFNDYAHNKDIIVHIPTCYFSKRWLNRAVSVENNRVNEYI